MVAELKMACNDHLIHTRHRFESVAPIDITAAVQQRMEILTAQQELQKLGVKIKEEFIDVFSKIPHLDELPTDVYCQRTRRKQCRHACIACRTNTGRPGLF